MTVDPVDPERSVSSRTVAAITESFRVTLALERPDVFEDLSSDAIDRLGRAAAEGVLASVKWSRVVGDRIDTSEASRLLGVTRQALSKRQATGSIVGLPGHGTTWYPVWQFDTETRSVRTEVREVISAFRDALDDVDPKVIAAWANTRQDVDLDGNTPAEWMQAGQDPHRLREAALRAAADLAR